MKIISIILILVSASLSIKHGWDGFRPPSPESAKLMANLGITQAIMPYFSIFSIIIGVMLLFPQAFFVGNVLNAITIVLIMALSLRAGDVKTTLIEIPFLALPLVLIWLKYPFKF
jgi:hypothetical protein